jgi:small subunit ribosomal protein S20
LEENELANIKSAKKRILVNRKKAARNKSIKSSVTSAIKKVYVAIDAKDKEAAAKALTAATRALAKATSKGVYHKNTSSRKISRLAHAVNKMSA